MHSKRHTTTGNSGSSARDDLFTPKSVGGNDSSRSYDQNRQASPVVGMNSASAYQQQVTGRDDSLELEHVIGYTGRGYNTVQFHPTDENMLISW